MVSLDYSIVRQKFRINNLPYIISHKEFVSTSSITQSQTPDFWFNDILAYVMNYLSAQDLFKCLVVCKKFNRIASNILYKNTIINKKKIHDKFIRALNLSNYETLHLSPFRYIKILDFGSRKNKSIITDYTIKLLLSNENILNSVRALNLSFCENVTDKSLLEIFDNFREIQKLLLNHCINISDHAFQVSKPLYIKHLELFGCTKLTNTCLDLLAFNCKQLQTFRVSDAKKINGDGLASLFKTQMLYSVDIENCGAVESHNILTLSKKCKYLRRFTMAAFPGQM
jgi:hypothetical protein